MVGAFGVLSVIAEDSTLCTRWLPEDRLPLSRSPAGPGAPARYQQSSGGSKEMGVTRQNNKCYLSGLPRPQPVIFIVLQNNGIY